MITCAFEDQGQAALRHAVVDCIVLKENKILLVKRALRLIEGGKWGLAGGFAERDETLVQAATREVFEETGWNIKGITLLRIIDSPERRHDDRQNIVFVYFATATSKTGVADDESDECKWFEFSNLPPSKNIAFDHMEIIELYQKYRHKPFPLPIV